MCKYMHTYVLFYYSPCLCYLLPQVSFPQLTQPQVMLGTFLSNELSPLCHASSCISLFDLKHLSSLLGSVLNAEHMEATNMKSLSEYMEPW